MGTIENTTPFRVELREIRISGPLKPSEGQIGDFLTVFESEGYQRCEHGEPEDGLDKADIFLNDWGAMKHIAFQPRGADHWLSKLGEWYDIKHEKVDAVGGSLYGWPDIYLSRGAA